MSVKYESSVGMIGEFLSVSGLSDPSSEPGADLVGVWGSLMSMIVSSMSVGCRGNRRS
jgi:hypothetical protein